VAYKCPQTVGHVFARWIVLRFRGQDDKTVDGSRWIGNATIQFATQGLFVSGVDSFDKNDRYVYLLILIIYSTKDASNADPLQRSSVRNSLVEGNAAFYVF
jgi:hypothetical protein